MIAEGGTEYGYMETISRSKNIWGSYQSNPDNPILTHRGASGQNNQIQGTGHADIVQAKDGSWWMVFLAFRKAGGDFHHLGRESFLTPITWNKQGWPVVSAGDTVGIIVQTKTLPLFPFKPMPVKDDFTETKLALQWNFLRNPDKESWSLTEKPGFLRLKGNEVSLNQASSPAWIGRRQQHFNFSATTFLDFTPQKNNEEAGITVLMNEKHHYDLFVTHEDGKRVVKLRYRIGNLIHTEKVQMIPEGHVILSASGTPEWYTFSYSLEGKTDKMELGKMETRYLSSEVAGGFTGVYIAMYATGNGLKSSVPADFDWFEYLGN